MLLVHGGGPPTRSRSQVHHDVAVMLGLTDCVPSPTPVWASQNPCSGRKGRRVPVSERCLRSHDGPGAPRQRNRRAAAARSTGGSHPGTRAKGCPVNDLLADVDVVGPDLARPEQDGGTDDVRATLGSACGLLVQGTIAAVGLSALVMPSARALTAVKLLGGIYLIWLGVTTWRSTWRGVEPASTRRHLFAVDSAQGLWSGLWSNVHNPKAASAYRSLVPQFLTSSHPIAPKIATLAVAHVAVLLV